MSVFSEFIKWIEGYYGLFSSKESLNPDIEYFVDRSYNGKISLSALCNSNTHPFGHQDTPVVADNPDVLFPHFESSVFNVVIESLPQYCFLHASGVIKQNMGFIFPSVPMSGKTSLVIALASGYGFKYVSDDLIPIEPSSHLMKPFPTGLCIREGTVSLFEDLRKVCLKEKYIKFKGENRWYLLPKNIEPAENNEPYEINYIIFPQYDPYKRPHLTCISKSSALIRLIKSMFNFHIYREKCLDFLTKIVNKSHCYSLVTNSIKPTCSLINDLISRQINDAKSVKTATRS